MRRRIHTSPADAPSWSLICGLAAACLVLDHGLGFTVLPARAVLPGAGVAALIGALAIGRWRGNVESRIQLERHEGERVLPLVHSGKRPCAVPFTE